MKKWCQKSMWLFSVVVSHCWNQTSLVPHSACSLMHCHARTACASSPHRLLQTCCCVCLLLVNGYIVLYYIVVIWNYTKYLHVFLGWLVIYFGALSCTQAGLTWTYIGEVCYHFISCCSAAHCNFSSSTCSCHPAHQFFQLLYALSQPFLS